MEERAAGTAVALRDLDAHHAEIEEPVDERTGDAGMLVHLANERSYLRLGELAHAVAQNQLVFAQRGERQGVFGGAFDRQRSLLGGLGRGPSANVIIALRARA